VEKSSPKICATSVIFKTLPKENNPPLGENSPKLVTLIVTLVYMNNTRIFEEKWAKIAVNIPSDYNIELSSELLALLRPIPLMMFLRTLTLAKFLSESKI
jgi:hypothetical protein